MNTMTDLNFDGMQEVKTPTIKFGKVGDWFKGTLTANDREVENKLSSKPGSMQKIYEFKIKGGSFHGITDLKVHDESTELKEGEFWSYFAKPAVQAQMRNAKLGQIVGMRFAEEKPNPEPGKHPTHVIKVYLGDMDPEYHGEQSGDTLQA